METPGFLRIWPCVGLARCLMHALAEEASRLKCYKARVLQGGRFMVGVAWIKDIKGYLSLKRATLPFVTSQHEHNSKWSSVISESTLRLTFWLSVQYDALSLFPLVILMTQRR